MGTITAHLVVTAATGNHSHLLRADGLTECGRAAVGAGVALGAEQAIVNAPGRTFQAFPTCRVCSRHLTDSDLTSAGFR